MNIRTATPVEIDSRIAELSEKLAGVSAKLDSVTKMIFNWAGRCKYVPARRRGERSHYEMTGTYEEAVDIVAHMWAQEQAHQANSYGADTRPDHWGDHNRSLPFEGPGQRLAERQKLSDERYRLRAEIQELDNEWVARGRWSRFFLVTSSNGHIHSSTGCSTCRWTTTYGWMPERSGQTEAEAIEALGAHAEALCSVCFPTAPVRADRTNITKAKALKMSAGPVVGE